MINSVHKANIHFIVGGSGWERAFFTFIVHFTNVIKLRNKHWNIEVISNKVQRAMKNIPYDVIQKVTKRVI